MMEAGTGIGGFSKNREELVASKFDLFSHPEYETGVKKLIPQTFRPISLLQVKDHIHLLFQVTRKN